MLRDKKMASLSDKLAAEAEKMADEVVIPEEVKKEKRGVGRPSKKKEEKKYGKKK